MNWREDQTPMRKVVWEHSKEERMEREVEWKTEEDDLKPKPKKKAIWANIRENQTPKNAPGL